MAIVTARHRWADGSSLGVTVEVQDSYPDCVNEARINARALLRDALADVASFAEDDE